MSHRRIDCDDDWQSIRSQWRLASGVTYLNHGSFGPPPRVVAERREQLRRELDAQPMRFFVEQLEPAWLAARDQLAAFVGSAPSCLALVENATYAMNVVADSFPLSSNDEVLLTNHVYGAVRRIWDRACDRAGAAVRSVNLEDRSGESETPWLHDPQEIVERVTRALGPRTRLLILSHITSATAMILPVTEIIQAAHARNVAVCIDGPHAVAQLPLNLTELDCDFYCASCHKWLSAPFGTGFVYAAPRWHAHMQPPLLSWGRVSPTTPETWVDELLWSGTRDYSGMLALPSAIDFLEQVGLDDFRQRTRWLAQYAARQLQAAYRLPAMAEPYDTWYAAMAHFPLPPGPALPLQRQLRAEYGIEVPIIEFAERRWVRVSCYLYNDCEQVDRLVQALSKLVPP